jgi:branched-subunit amino acid aminotransferase/4-amino-4-deoxychorismate lyase
MLILINDQWMSKNEANINIFSESVMYGFGLFETLRTYREKRIPFLDKHISRLIKSAFEIELSVKYSADQIKNMVKKIVYKSEFELQRIRIMLIENKVIISSEELIIDKKIYNGVKINTVHLTRSLPHLKSNSYLECYLSYIKATQLGYFEALLLDEAEHIYEGSRSNIFWFEDKILCTRYDKVLPGIMRDFIINSSPFQICYKQIELKTLLKKNEMFLTNSIVGIVPIIKIDKNMIGSGRCGILTKRLMNEYLIRLN